MSPLKLQRYRHIALSLLLPLAPTLNAAEEMKPLWEAGFGPAGLYFPDYRGADHSSSYLLPFPYLVYRGDVLKVDRKGLRGLLFQSDKVWLDISLNGATPVDSDQNGAREGMPDLDPVFEIGPSLKVSLYHSDPLSVRFDLPYRYVYATDFSTLDAHGTVIHPNLTIDYDRDWSVGLTFGPLYASKPYHDYYYSVAPEYATAARPAYRAEGGYSGMRYTLGLSRRFKRWWVGAFVRYDDLRGAAFTDSPLVRQEDALMAGMSFAWVFGQSQQLVQVEEHD